MMIHEAVQRVRANLPLDVANDTFGWGRIVAMDDAGKVSIEWTSGRKDFVPGLIPELWQPVMRDDGSSYFHLLHTLH